MRLTFLRLFPVLIGCAAIACSGSDEVVTPAADSSPEDSGAEVTTDSSAADTSVVDTSPSDAESDASDSSDADDTAEVATSFCGNGKLEGTEECDDGNLFKDDGCSNVCKLESKSEGDLCPGKKVTLEVGADGKRSATITGDTSLAYAHDEHSCGGGSGTDLVYAVTSPVSGNIRVRLDATFPATLATRKTCTDPASERSCASTPTAATLTGYVSLLAGETAYVFVDGAGPSAGAFTLYLEQTASYCGDGVAGVPEQCDDGNAKDGDGCSSTCALESKPSADTCPGPIYAFAGTGTTPRKISFSGDLSTSKGDVSTNICVGGSLGFDQVFQLVPDVTGSLAVEMRASFLDFGVYLRKECGNALDSRFDLDCAVSKSAPARFTAPVEKGVPVWLVADSRGLGLPTGAFSVDAVLSPAVCGNGVLDGGEQCDDGNTTAGDGCSATCTVEGATGNSCTDAEALTPVAKGDGTYAVTKTGSTVGLANDFGKSGCDWSNPNTAPDAVYKFVAPIDGLLSAKLDPTFQATLQVRATCVNGADGTADACKVTSGTAPVTQTFPVVTGNTYYVIVDGPSTGPNLKGSYQLGLSIAPGKCGNGVLEGSEQCDDLGTASGDGCDSTCLLEPALEGSTCLTPKAVTLTDDGSGLYTNKLAFGTTNMKALKSFTSVCPSAGREAFFKVTAPVDGNLFAEVSNTTFDATLAARSSCTPDTGDTNRLACSGAVKGLGDERIAFPVVAGKDYFLVVDGALLADYGRFDLKVVVSAARCGDLVVGPGEECDDGNTTIGDGCDSSCKAEPIAGFDTCPGYRIDLAGTGSTPRTTSMKFTTSTLAPDYVGVCGGSGRDGVFQLVPDVGGELEVQLSGGFNTALYARSECTRTLSELGCTYANDATTGTRTLRFAVSAKTPVYLFVDGRDGESGFATFTAKLTP